VFTLTAEPGERELLPGESTEIEAAWHYRRPPRVAGSLARRQSPG
jgi:hypothetical protein